MSQLDWDMFAVSEFFLHEGEESAVAGEAMWVFAAGDAHLTAEVHVIPTTRVVGFTLRGHGGATVLDIALVADSRLEPRRRASGEYLYCHECRIAPGLHALWDQAWYSYLDYTHGPEGNRVSLDFTWRPAVALRFLDTRHESRPKW